MKLARVAGLAGILLACSIPAGAGIITFTCSSGFDSAFDPAGSTTAVCNYLNTTIAGEYESTFTNANANIYIDVTSSGLAESTSGHYNLFSYSTYESKLQAESTDGARTTVPSSEPSIFGGLGIEITSALAEALGITRTLGGGNVEGTTASGSACTTYATQGSGCYNGLILLNDPTDLYNQTGQGYTYRGLGGSTTASTSNYDFFGAVEHELDEILGTSSCIDTQSGSLTDPGNCAAAADLFRYSAGGVRTFNTLNGTAYFSADGGYTDYEGNLYDNTANGNDWADFLNNCTFVQDGYGCPNGQTFDILSDGPGGTTGPEVAILNAVGYDLAAPEPGTLGMMGLALAGLLACRKRLRQAL